MKFRVIGSHKDTGARMVLEMQADSKAAAERKAAQGGMYVTRVEDADLIREEQIGRPRVGKSRSGGGIAGFLVLAAIGTAIWYFWPQIRQLLGR